MNPIQDGVRDELLEIKETKLKRDVERERQSKAESNRGRLKLKNSVEWKDFKCLDCGDVFASSKM